MKSRLLIPTLASISAINNKNKVTTIYSLNLKQYSQELVFSNYYLKPQRILPRNNTIINFNSKSPSIQKATTAL